MVKNPEAKTAAFQADLSEILSRINETKSLKIVAEAGLAQVNSDIEIARILLEQINTAANTSSRISSQESEHHKNQILEWETKIKTLQDEHAGILEEIQKDKENLIRERSSLESSFALKKADYDKLVSWSDSISEAIVEKQISNSELGVQVLAKNEYFAIISAKIKVAEEALERIRIETELNIQKQQDLGAREIAAVAEEKKISQEWRSIKIMQDRLTPEYQKVFQHLL